MRRTPRPGEVLVLIALLATCLGARRIQGPIWGTVETSDGAVLEDVVVRLRCASYMIHGAWPSDYETRIVATGQHCSVVFSSLSVSLLIFYVLLWRRETNYLLLLVLLLPGVLLLANVLPARFGLTAFHIKSARFSPYFWVLCAIACAYSIREITNGFLKTFLALLALFSGIYYAIDQSDIDYLFGIRRDAESYRFYSWIRENIGRDSLFLLYDSGPIETAMFYGMAGREYLLPSTNERVVGTTWESGFISGTKHHQYVIERVDEWMALEKTDAGELAEFLARYEVSHILHCIPEDLGARRTAWRERAAIRRSSELAECDQNKRCCVFERTRPLEKSIPPRL